MDYSKENRNTVNACEHDYDWMGSWRTAANRSPMEEIVREFVKENTKYLAAEIARLSEKQDILSKKIQILDERTKLPKPSVPIPSYQVECPYLPAGHFCPGFKKKSSIRRLIEYISR